VQGCTVAKRSKIWTLGKSSVRTPPPDEKAIGLGIKNQEKKLSGSGRKKNHWLEDVSRFLLADVGSRHPPQGPRGIENDLRGGRGRTQSLNWYHGGGGRLANWGRMEGRRFDLWSLSGPRTKGKKKRSLKRTDGGSGVESFLKRELVDVLGSPRDRHRNQKTLCVRSLGQA